MTARPRVEGGSISYCAKRCEARYCVVSCLGERRNSQLLHFKIEMSIYLSKAVKIEISEIVL